MNLKTVSVVLALAATQSISTWATPYLITPLPSPPDSLSTFALGVASTTIVGASSGDQVLALRWENGIFSILPAPAGASATALAVNDLGDVVGSALLPGQTDTRPVVWHNNQFQVLGTGGMTGGSAVAINNLGVTVGVVRDSTHDTSQAALWTGENPIVLENFPGSQTNAVAINTSGMVLVNVNFPDSHVEDWIWSNGTLMEVPSLGGAVTIGYAINDSGEVVGSGSITGETDGKHAFIFKNNEPALLPELNAQITSLARAINDSDQIVGTAYLTASGGRAVLWQNDQVFDLNTLIPADSGWSLLEANDIADDGTIVGYGLYDGQVSAYQLTPTGSASSSLATPEPTTFLLLLLTSPLLLRRRVPNNQPNRRMRTRMSGGVGGREPRGSPLSRFCESAF